MPLFFSVYLDLCRALAALTVFFIHIPFSPVIQRLFDAKWRMAHDAVIVFFVLSGYVISYAAAEVEKTGFNYVTSRIARIFPVAFSAIALSAFFSYLAHDLRPDLYVHAYQLHHLFRYFTISLLFLNRIWWNEINPFEDGPYWTMPYEVWDYVFYGILIFLKGRQRLLWLGLTLLITGPCFALILPVWLAGSLAYHWRDKFTLSRAGVAFLCIAPLLVYAVVKLCLPTEWDYHLVGQPLAKRIGHNLNGAAGFLWDNILGVLVAVHLWAMRHSGMKFLAHDFLAKPIRWFAALSFSLYIYHLPIRYFLWSYFRPEFQFGDGRGKIALYLATFSIVYLLASLIEQRKGYFRQLLRRWLRG